MTEEESNQRASRASRAREGTGEARRESERD